MSNVNPFCPMIELGKMSDVSSLCKKKYYFLTGTIVLLVLGIKAGIEMSKVSLFWASDL